MGWNVGDTLGPVDAASDFQADLREYRGRVAYEAAVRARPTYHDGMPRKAWSQLGQAERWTWIREPRRADHP